MFSSRSAVILKLHHFSRADAFIRRKADRERRHRILHVPRQVDVFGNRPDHIGLLRVAQLLMPGSPGKSTIRSVPPAGCTRITTDLGVPLDRALPGASADTMLTAPLGLMMSFTKYAVSLIIGPHPASYQPTDPSSKRRPGTARNYTCFPRNLVRQTQAHAMHPHRFRIGDLAHHIDVMHPAVDDGRTWSASAACASPTCAPVDCWFRFSLNTYGPPKLRASAIRRARLGVMCRRM